ncbi:MAG: 1-acyl-sn-glycerol-3-phosphate acyltransferase, partial [Actinomycetota bacterium]
MDRVPPRWARRLIIAPVVLVICLSLIAISPVLLVLAAVVDLLVPGNWRSVRIVAFGTFFVFMEAAGLVVLFGMWVRFGFGTRVRSERSRDTHYRLMTFYLLLMYKA